MSHRLTRELNSLVDDAIRTYGKRRMDSLELSVDDLPDFIQDELVRMFWEVDNRDIDVLTQTDDTDNILSAIAKMFDKRSTLNKLDVADIIHKSVKDYYYTKVDSLIDERISYLKSFWKEPTQDREDYYLGAY